jgi:hypothetical protein
MLQIVLFTFVVAAAAAAVVVVVVVVVVCWGPPSLMYNVYWVSPSCKVPKA